MTQFDTLELYPTNHCQFRCSGCYANGNSKDWSDEKTQNILNNTYVISSINGQLANQRSKLCNISKLKACVFMLAQYFKIPLCMYILKGKKDLISFNKVQKRIQSKNLELEYFKMFLIIVIKYNIEATCIIGENIYNQQEKYLLTEHLIRG